MKQFIPVFLFALMASTSHALVGASDIGSSSIDIQPGGGDQMISFSKDLGYKSGEPNDKLYSNDRGGYYVPIGHPCTATFNSTTHEATMTLHKSNFNDDLLAALGRSTDIRITDQGENYKLRWNNLKFTSVAAYPEGRNLVGYQGFWLNKPHDYYDNKGNVFFGGFNTYTNINQKSGRIYAMYINHNFECKYRNSTRGIKACWRTPFITQDKSLACHVSYVVK